MPKKRRSARDRMLPDVIWGKDFERAIKAAGRLAGANDVAAARNRAIVAVFLYTGIRLSELQQLQISDFRLDKGAEKVRVLGKGRKERLIDLSKKAVVHVQAYLAVRPVPRVPGDQSVFISRIGLQLSARQLEYLAENLGTAMGLTFRCHPHTFRHSFATYLYQRTGDIVFVSAMLDHEDLETTMRYIHAGSEKAKAVLDRL